MSVYLLCYNTSYDRNSHNRSRASHTVHWNQLICKNLPKVLLPINNVPFIIILINFFIKQGYNKFYVLTGYRSSMIENAIKKYDLKNIKILKDGKKLKGTGGAIKKSLNIIREDFFLIYGDTFLPVNFNSVEKAYLSSNKLSLMTVLKNDNKWDRSNVLFKNSRLIEYNKQSPSNKMRYIDYGLSVVSASVFDTYSNDSFFDLSSVYESLSTKKQIEGFEVYKRFYEIGTPSSIKETEEYLLSLNKKSKFKL
jgi:NDP-sugar pyrophosphorylase family protein